MKITPAFQYKDRIQNRALPAFRLTPLFIAIIALACVVLAAYSAPVQAQTETSLVSNTAETRVNAGSNAYFGQSFTTGANSGGYTITEVSVRVYLVPVGSSTAVKIRENGSDNLPGNEVATLNNPTTLTDNTLHVFTAPTNTTLNASTTYWISVNDGAGSNRVNYDSTTSDAQAGETGWTIGDSSIWRAAETSDWSTQNASLVVEVKGYANAAASTDATLSALTVSPKNIIGFNADRTSYEVGVASTVSQATIAATANDSGATVAITPADAADVTDGHQVSLSAGRNAVTITVTAEDTTTTKTYTISVNQGVTTPLGWKAESDVDSLKHHGLERPRGVWTDSDNIWVVDRQERKIHGFNRTTQALTRTIDLDTSKQNYAGVWSDGTHIWVSYTRPVPAGLIAYQISDGARATDKDFTTLGAAGNTRPFAIWSDGITMWVGDYVNFKAYAYHVADDPGTPENEFATRDGDKDISLSNLWNRFEFDPTGVWSDGSTIWVAAAPFSDPLTIALRAYRQSDRAHQAHLDIDISASGNDNPGGIYYDGSTFFVTDTTDDKVYAYNMPPASTNATLSSLTVSPRNIIGFNADGTYYEVGVASTVSQATIAATANDSGATLAITPADADDMTDGHQVNLTAGRNEVTVTVTAEDTTTTQEYTVDVNQGVTDDFGWKAVDDIDGLTAAVNTSPYGTWSDGTTVWVGDFFDRKIFAYQASDGAPNPAQDFETLDAADNHHIISLWSDGITMWVADSDDVKIYAYRMSDKQRDSSKDFDTLVAADNDHPRGLWSDGATMWVADSEDDKIYAYRMSDKQNQPERAFETLSDAGNTGPTGITSNGETMWVADIGDRKIYAYKMADTERDASKDFNTLEAAANNSAQTLWSDANTMLVTDLARGKVFSYNIPVSTNANLGSLIISPDDIIGFDAERVSYEVGVPSDIPQATVLADPLQAYATVSYSGTDASTDAGHQVNLSAGQNTVTVTVTAQDGMTTKPYTVNINRGVAEDYGWKASDDLDGFAAEDLFGQVGIAGSGSTYWVTTENDPNIYAFNILGYAKSTEDITPHSDNGNPAYLWANATNIYVVDDNDTKAYVYQLSDGARQTSSEFSFHADNADPAGIWSDGATVWIVDTADTKLYAYTLSGGARDGDKDIDLDSDNGDPTGVASNGTTIWVADATDDKVYAYELESGDRIATKEVNALTGAGNTDPTGMWVTSATLLVNDVVDSKAYSYNVPSDIPLQEMDDATLSALTVAPKDIIGFDAGQDYYEVGFASTVAQATVTATPTNSAATLAITPADAGSADGHQVDLSAGRNTVTITVTSQDGNETEVYTLSLNRGVTAAYGWKASDDFDGLIAARLETPEGMWSNGTTMWVGDWVNNKLVAYSVAAKTRQTANDVNLHNDNSDPRGIWSDQTTIWVADNSDDKIYAYQLSDGARDASKDFDTLAAGNNAPRGIWSDGTTMWVLDQVDDKIYAYQMSDKQRDQDKEFEELATANTTPKGIWSDGVIMWVLQSGTSAKLFAYRMSDKQHDESRDFNTLAAIGSQNPSGITSDGVTMWVANAYSLEIGGLYFPRTKVFSFNMAPASTDATLGSLTVSPRDIIGFETDRTSYEVGVASDVTQATVTALPNNDYGTIVYSGTDADLTADGHQVNLSAGRNEVTVTVTAQDTTTTEEYTLSVNRGVDTAFGWKAVDDLDGLEFPGIDSPEGITKHGDTIWVSGLISRNILAYRTDGQRDKSRDITPVSANQDPSHIWTDGTDLWVVDHFETKIHVYRLTDGQRQQSKEITLHDENVAPSGIWSNKETIWVLDSIQNKAFAYSLAGGARQNDAEFNLTSANDNPIGLWSDGETIWVADNNENKIFAYRTSNGNRRSSKDFNTLIAAGNQVPAGITSDGTTMWVADGLDDKIYSFNMPVSDNADLRSLTVSPRDIVGFDPDRTSYEVGVGSTLTRATVTAENLQAFATVAYIGTDASAGTPGHQVDLSPGKNTATVTVTAQDESTKTYTVNINRGVTDPFGWKAEHDLDALIRASSTDRPAGVAEHSGMIWVTTTQSNQILAYRADGQRAPSRDITLASANGRPGNIWTDGTYIWVLDLQDRMIYVYRLSDGQRQQAKEFTLHGDSFDPTGIWSDGETMWVVEALLTTTHAYSLDGGARQQEHEFDLVSDNMASQGVWSDGYTIWLADRGEDKVYAYRLSTGNRESDKDFNTLSAAGNNEPGGITSDGTTMWVVDSDRNKVYSYNMPLAPPATFQAQSGDTQVTLTWANPDNSDITGYQYRVSNDGGSNWDPNWTPIPGSSHRTTSFTIRNLQNGVEHVIEVRALESVLQSAGVRATVTPLGPPGLPLEPTNLKVDSLDQQLRFSWGPPSAEDLRVPTTSYDVRHRRYGRSDRWQNATRSNTDLTTVQLVTGLTNRVPYEVQVAAVNSIGRGPWAAYSGVPQGHQSPPAAGGDAGLDLGPLGVHWTDGNNPHALHRDTADLNRNVIRNQCLSTETFTVFWDVLDRTPEEYQAHFITDGGAGEVTHEYRTERVRARQNQEREQQYIRGRVTVHRDTRVTVRVRARFDPEGWSTWSHPAALYCYEGPTASQSQFQLARAAVAPPDNLQAQSGDTTVTLTWNQAQSDAITGYEYRVSVDTGGTWSPDWTLVPGSTGETTSFTVEGLANGLLHTFDVRTLERQLRSEQARAAATPRGAVTTPPEAPGDLELRGSDGALRASWKHPAADPRAPITSYDVRYRIYGSSDPWTEVTRSDTDRSNRQTISRLTNRVAYEVQVAAVNRIGQGPWTTDSRVPQPNQPRPDEAADANADLRLTNVAAWWTTSDHGSRHPDTTSVNVIENQCLDTESFIVQSDDLNRQPEEFEAHFITYAGAGEVTHEFRTENGQARIYGSVPLHRGSNVRVQVRARFDPEGWTTWSKAAAFYCFVPEPEDDEQQPAQQNEPANTPATGKPAIAGTAEQGETLTAATGSIADVNGIDNAVFTYQWSRDNGTTTTAIEGAASASYTVHEDDVGNQVSVTVSFADDDGFQESLTSDSVLVSPPSPLYGGFDADTVPQDHNGQDPFTFQIHFSEEPSLGYAAVRGHVLTVTGGAVTAASQTTPGENVRWTITLQPDGDDAVTVELPATASCSDNGAVCTASGKMLSNATSITVAGPVTQQTPPENSPATGQPTIDGTAQVGQTLTADVSGVSDGDGLTNAVYAYQWIANNGNADTSLEGATSATYAVQVSQVGNSLKVQVSFSDDNGNQESLTSQATAAVSATTPGAPRSLAAEPAGTGELSVSWQAPQSNGGAEVTGYTVQWKLDSGRWDTPADVSQATTTGASHTITRLQLDVEYDVRVMATNSAGDGPPAGQVTATPTAKSSQQRVNSPAAGRPAITGQARVGKTLTADTSGITDADGLENATFAYQWSANGLGIHGAVGSTYTLTGDKEGDRVQALVSFTDDEGNEESLISAATEPVEPRANRPATGAPTISGTPQVGETLSVHTSDIADADGLDNAEFSYQWGASGIGIPGATGSSYTISEDDEGLHIQVMVSFTDDAGNSETLMSESTGAVASAPEQEPETAEPPGAPSGLSATLNDDGSITLTWNAPTGDVDGYQILRRRPQQGESELAVYVGDTGNEATTWTDTGTSLDTRYVYRVKARNGDLLSEWSNYARIDK